MAFGVALRAVFLRLGGGGERQIAAAEGAVDVRLLRVMRRGHDVVMGHAERDPDVETGRGQVLQQRRRKRAVLAFAVRRSRSVTRGV
jgi:hypothetical protein